MKQCKSCKSYTRVKMCINAMGTFLQWRHEGFCRLGQRSVVPPIQPVIPILSALNKLTRSSADADNRRARSVEVNKHSTIPSFLLCFSNFVFQTRPFHDIRLQKMS